MSSRPTRGFNCIAGVRQVGALEGGRGGGGGRGDEEGCGCGGEGEGVEGPATNAGMRGGA